MPRTEGLAEGQWAEWGAPTGRHCAWVHSRCVTVGEYYDIKQHHSGLCALTQGTLCTFLQGWGDEGESEWEALVVVVFGGGDALCWQLTVWTAIAVLKLSCPLGEVLENTMGRTLHENNRGIYYVLNDCAHNVSAGRPYGMHACRFLPCWFRFKNLTRLASRFS